MQGAIGFLASAVGAALAFTSIDPAEAMAGVALCVGGLALCGVSGLDHE